MEKKLESRNLNVAEMEHFLEKYIRFLTKDIYISKSTYQNFIHQYQYLIQVLERDSLLYQNQANYQKMRRLLDHQVDLLKLHNIKYLKKKVEEDHAFFNTTDPKGELDLSKRQIILSEEEQFVYINEKSNIPFLVSKVRYLVEVLKKPEEKILILGTSEENLREFRTELCKQGFFKVLVLNLKEYRKQFLKEGEKVLRYKQKYDLLRGYIFDVIFPDKKRFTPFYQEFQNYLYFNKDYKDFETFRDYHHYMYKRMFLESKLSLKKFNENETKKRRKVFRTIENEIVSSKDLVDLANFFYLNSIPYHYLEQENTFLIGESNQNTVSFQKGYYDDLENPIKGGKKIVLYEKYQSGKKYLEVLIYELIKRRYSMEKRTDEEIYAKLRETTMDGYVMELIQKVLIPAVDYYEKYGRFEETRLTPKQVQFLQPMLDYYFEMISKQKFITEEVLDRRIGERLEKKRNTEMIFWDVLTVPLPKKYFLLLSQYKENILLKDHVKLFLEYKKYLIAKKWLPIPHTFTSLEELNSLTSQFMKENLQDINENISKKEKPLIILPYDDTKRILAKEQLEKGLVEGIMNHKKESIVIGLTTQKEISNISRMPSFSKIDQKTVMLDGEIRVPCEEVFQLKKNYSIIILPFLIQDYQENLFEKNGEYFMKLQLYAAISRCSEGVILFCPKSQQKKLDQLLTGYTKMAVSPALYV